MQRNLIRSLLSPSALSPVNNDEPHSDGRHSSYRQGGEDEAEPGQPSFVPSLSPLAP